MFYLNDFTWVPYPTKLQGGYRHGFQLVKSGHCLFGCIVFNCFALRVTVMCPAWIRVPVKCRCPGVRGGGPECAPGFVDLGVETCVDFFPAGFFR